MPIAKNFDIVKYLKNEKNQKLKKKKRKRKQGIWPKKAQNGKKVQTFFQANNLRNKTKKISIAKLNSVQWLERYSLSQTC